MSFLTRFLGIVLLFLAAPPFATVYWLPDVWQKTCRSNHWSHPWVVNPPVIALGAAVGLALLMLVVSMVLEGLNPTTKLPESTAFGSARFATTEEMREALFQLRQKQRALTAMAFALLLGRSNPKPRITDGVVLCQEDTAVLRREAGINGRPKWLVEHGAPLVRVAGHHILIEAKTGAGKGQGPLLATLLSDRRSVVALDPKSDEGEGGELYKLSAGFRSTFSVVRRFAPTESGWHGFNPLAEIPLGKTRDKPHRREGTEAMRIANVLTGGVAKDDANSRIFWKSAEVLLTCAILDRLWNATADEDKSLPGVYRLLSRPPRERAHAKESPKEAIRRIICERAPKSAEDHANRLLMIDSRILEGAFDTALDVLSYCGDDLIAGNLSRSDFKASDLFDGERPMSLYISIPFADADILKPLARLMTNMLIASHLRSPNFKQQTVYLLDEFDDLGRLPAIEKAITKIRSYGVQLVLVTQTRQQIYAIYEHNADILLDNLAVQMVWGVSGRNAAQKIAEGIGKTTIVSEMVATGESTKGLLDATSRSKNRSIKEHGRDLMTADEVTTMAGCDCLLFAPEMRPYLGKSVVCYSMPAFQARSQMFAPARSAA